jgi:hypothetical protein
MSTLDVWRSGSELVVIVTGTTTAPVAANFDAGAIVTLRPAKIDHVLPGHAATIINALPSTPQGDWWGELPVAKDAEQARIGVVIDGVSRNAVVRWEKPPAPQPLPEIVAQKPRQKRRRSLPAGEAAA